MKNLFFLFLFLANAMFAQERDYKAESAKVFSDILSRNFAMATANFDSSFAARFDSVKVRESWDRLISNFGPFKSVLEVTTDHQPNFDVVIQKLQLEKKKVDFKIVYGTNQKIKGISFLPGEPLEKYQLPEYYDEKIITEKPLIISNGPIKLPGILTFPKKPGRFPVVLLIHGSGPNDKDETVGSTKIFKDLAIGMANRGIAVYRYDKRSKVYKTKAYKEKNYTVVNETIEDAVAAIRMLKTDSLIDSTAIYLCGHGLGGTLLPRIADGIKGVKGLIYLTANARPLEDHFVDQMKYITSLDTTGRDFTALLDSVSKQAAKVKALKPGTTDTIPIFFNPPSYWVDLNQYDHFKAAQACAQPMLFINGGRDFQVTEFDFNAWQKALVNNKADFKMYPKLNHFLIAGADKSNPLEYNKKGNVDIQVVNDISNWILSNNK